MHQQMIEFAHAMRSVESVTKVVIGWDGNWIDIHTGECPALDVLYVAWHEGQFEWQDFSHTTPLGTGEQAVAKLTAMLTGETP